MRFCSQCPDWGLAPSIAPSSSLDTSRRPQAPFPQNGHPPRASKVAPGALWNGIKYRAVLGNRSCSSPSTHLVGSLCGACSPHLWTWLPPAQTPPITHQRPEHPKTTGGAPPPTLAHPGDGEGHIEVLASLQPKAPRCRPLQHHLEGLHGACSWEEKKR